ncbi:hypothetical protein BDQ12DRAFT_655543 [Crucibulum laeve]|uniref:DUF7702 domain-containing protein n=1 Tax=Crucibulum laeve TaxID=68775 RepID=A0A5C3LTY1_9AGAR|nr:hypothetical protein BDQ12DRAFT_655543 [Crucibulum laeve]
MASTSNPDINFAHLIGYHSVAAAVIFAILYIPLLGWFIFQSFRRPTYVHFVLSFFCSIRVTAFIIRAILAGSDSAGHNLNLLIADEILFGVGFFGLLYSAYTLVLDRESLVDIAPPTNIISSLTRNRKLFRLAMTAAVAIGITGSSMSQDSSPQSVNTGSTLRKISAIIFLVLTVLQAYQTCVLARMEMTSSGAYRHDNESFGMKNGIFILVAISLLLLIREAFSVATIGNLAKQNNEHFWYPLLALPEILAVVLYATPGLVPPRAELPK